MSIVRSPAIFVLVCCMSVFSHPKIHAQDVIYRCASGDEVRFTNVAKEARGCKKIVIKHPKRKKPTVQDRVAEKSFPHVDAVTQRTRDEGRDSLIRKELDSQKITLSEIMKKLTHFEITAGEQQQQIEAFKALQEERRMREQNIAELEKQLGEH